MNKRWRVEVRTVATGAVWVETETEEAALTRAQEIADYEQDKEIEFEVDLDQVQAISVERDGESEEEQYERLSTLHGEPGGDFLRLGSSEIIVRQHPEGDFGVYAQELHGEARVPDPWCFGTLEEAEERAFAVAEQLGHV